MPNNKKKESSYDVGYGKPPAHTRFKPGQSGNPKGRPKGHNKTLPDVLSEVINETVVVNENGRRKTITKLETIVKQLVNKAAAGDARSTKLVIELIPKSDNPPQIVNLIFDEADSRL